MKTQTILYIVLALLLGLFGGYLLFGGSPEMEHDHASSAAGGQAQSSATIWTCSMHPQIQRDEPGDCPICGMDLIPQSSAASTDPAILTMTEAAVALARVRTTVVGEGGPSGGDAGAEVSLTGRLAADDRTAAVESVDFAGRLERLFVTYPGEQVRSGQQIATIYSPELVVAQEELLEALRLQTLSPELLTAARNKLRNLEITDAQIAEIEESGEVRTNFPVYADRNGTVLEVRARVGDYVSTGAPLYTLTDLSRLWALFDTYERDLSAINVGDPVTFSVASLPDQTFRARVTFIDPLLDAGTRTASVRAEVINSRGRLKPEMFITGTIATAARRKVPDADRQLTVPATAVLWTGERSVVYVALSDREVPTYEFREVVLGDRSGSEYGVVSGLAPGEAVVTNGAFSIDAAAQLNNQLSMMNREVVIRGREPEDITVAVLPDYSEAAPAAFRDQLEALVEAYLLLKDQMVSSRMADETILSPLRKSLAKVDMSLLQGDAHRYWMEQLTALQDHLTQLESATDLAAQRRSFGFLSQALINSLTAFGAQETIYLQNCPMAYDGQGGNWLSREAAIRNPFFGDEMLTCGSTVDTLTLHPPSLSNQPF